MLKAFRLGIGRGVVGTGGRPRRWGWWLEVAPWWELVRLREESATAAEYGGALSVIGTVEW